jgi:predicted O-methyltransferase YrrM
MPGAMSTLREKLRFAVRHPVGFVRLAAVRANASEVVADDGRRLTTDVEAAALRELAAGARSGIVEIGVFDGGTTAVLASAARVPVFGIDPLIPDSMNPSLVGLEEAIRANLAFSRRFTFIKDYSFNAARTWNEPFDLIFVDGDHSYEGVRRDVDDWLPLLDDGGLLVLHDSARVASRPSSRDGWPGPVRVAQELRESGSVELVARRDSLTVLRKLASQAR